MFPHHVEPEFVKTGKPLGFFKLFSTWVWKILFPDRKFDSHFTKSMDGDMVKLCNRHSQEGPE